MHDALENTVISHLRSPEPSSGLPAGHAYQPPATQTERVVAEIWAEILDLPQVSVLDNFFDLGGHSVLVHMVHDRLAERLGEAPPMVDLFKHPTVRALARHLDGNVQEHDQPNTGRRAAERVTGLSRLGRQRAQRTPPAGRDAGRSEQW